APAPEHKSTIRRAFVRSIARRRSGPAGSYAPPRFTVNARKSVRASRNDWGQDARSWISTRCSRISAKLDLAPDYGQFRASRHVSLRTTPFHPRTGPLSEGQAWRRWAGYVVASSYELSHDREYHAIRNAAALFDVSPLYKYLITGRDAARLLDHIVTRNVGKAKVGQVLYTPWCDDEGKQIDDGTISVLGEQTYRMTSADPTLRWLHLNASGLDVKIEDVSETTAALSLQGPSSRAILQIAAERDLSALKYFRLTSAKIRNIPVTISRTGYTGDLGFEVWVDASQAVPLWDALIETGTPYGLTPAGMLALDVARTEAGLLRIQVGYFSSRHGLN